MFFFSNSRVILEGGESKEISFPAFTVLVPLNNEQFEGTIGSISIFGTTGKYIINFTEQQSITIKNPTQKNNTFIYQTFKLNNKCNYLDIYINPPKKLTWIVSASKIDSANISMAKKQAICFWFLWDTNYTYNFKLSNIGLGSTNNLMYKTQPDSTKYKFVYDNISVSPSGGSMEIVFKTGSSAISGIGEWSLTTSDNIIGQIHPNSSNMLCVQDSFLVYETCKWNQYYDYINWDESDNSGSIGSSSKSYTNIGISIIIIVSVISFLIILGCATGTFCNGLFGCCQAMLDCFAENCGCCRNISCDFCHSTNCDCCCNCKCCNSRTVSKNYGGRGKLTNHLAEQANLLGQYQPLQYEDKLQLNDTPPLQDFDDYASTYSNIYNNYPQSSHYSNSLKYPYFS